MPSLLISLGSNRGSRIFNCLWAIHRFAELCMGEVKGISSFYLTEPVGVPPQPWFVNCAAELQVVLSPRELLRLSQQVEAELGRETKGDLRPRPIDIDLLFYGQRVVDTSFLKIPHPGIPERGFVLQPLAEIAPDQVHPIHQQDVKEMLQNLRQRGRLIPLPTSWIFKELPRLPSLPPPGILP